MAGTRGRVFVYVAPRYRHKQIALVCLAVQGLALMGSFVGQGKESW